MKPQIKQIAAFPVISRRLRLTIPQIPAQSRPAVQSLLDAMNRLKIAPSGDMLYVYHGCNGDPAQEFDLEVCLPVPAGSNLQLQPPLEQKMTTPMRCLAVDYVGPMSGIGQAWMNLVQAIFSSGQKPTGESREIYKKWIGFDSAENVTELQQGIE